MISIKSWLSIMALTFLVALAGCGGGGEDDVYGPQFEVVASVDQRPVVGVNVFPGGQQTIYLPIGETIELGATGPVEWSFFVGGSQVGAAGNTIFYGGATIDELITTPNRFGLGTSSPAPLAAPVPMVIYATSVIDRSQVARIDIILIN